MIIITLMWKLKTLLNFVGKKITENKMQMQRITKNEDKKNKYILTNTHNNVTCRTADCSFLLLLLLLISIGGEHDK